MDNSLQSFIQRDHYGKLDTASQALLKGGDPSGTIPTGDGDFSIFIDPGG